MISLNEDALICDLAETYHIYDYKQYPLRLIGTLACGLRDNSRIKMLMSGEKQSLDIILSATISDKLSLLLWQNGGCKEENKPDSILESLMGYEKQTRNMGFESGADFEKFRASIVGNNE